MVVRVRVRVDSHRSGSWSCWVWIVPFVAPTLAAAPTTSKRILKALMFYGNLQKTQPGGIHQCVACARRRPSEPAAFQSLTFAAVQIYATNRKSAATATATNFQVKSRG
ncbi:hypothetical protein PC112_g6041 [Phytophthora cactorum]|nr:hypothetical protein PC112_g6041 [Phytophthora cactorum]